MIAIIESIPIHVINQWFSIYDFLPHTLRPGRIVYNLLCKDTYLISCGDVIPSSSETSSGISRISHCRANRRCAQVRKSTLLSALRYVTNQGFSVLGKILPCRAHLVFVIRSSAVRQVSSDNKRCLACFLVTHKFYEVCMMFFNYQSARSWGVGDFRNASIG